MDTTLTSTLGQRFARSLLARDVDGLRVVLDPALDFRGLTPGQPWEATTASATLDVLYSEWFEPGDEIYEVLSVADGHVLERQRVTYRFRVRNATDDYVCEQTAYYDETDGRISKLRILCSGMIPSAGRGDANAADGGV